MKETIGHFVAVIVYHIADVAEGKGLQYQVEHEYASAQASPEIGEENNIDRREAHDNANEHKLNENCSRDNGSQGIAVAERRAYEI